MLNPRYRKGKKNILCVEFILGKLNKRDDVEWF
jgi:hypothetical protein